MERGIALNDQGRFGEAIALYREVLESEPENARAHYELAFSLNAAGKFAECAQMGERTLTKAKSTRAELYHRPHRNLLGRRRQANQKAIEVYKKGLEEFPDDPNLAFTHAPTHLGQRHHRRRES